jgi:hypothetical protein
MVDQRRSHIPGVHLAICHSFYENDRVGSPAFPRILSEECLLLAYEKILPNRTVFTGEPEMMYNKTWSIWFSQCGGNMMQPAFVNRLNQSALPSNEATIPHYRANCFTSVRLSCTSTIILFNCVLGIHGISAAK